MRKILLWLLLILLLAGMALWFSASRIAERGLDYALARYNIPVQSYRLAKLGNEQLVFTDLVLGDEGELKAARAEVDISWEGRRPAAYRVRLYGVDVHARLIGHHVELGGVERFWQASGGTLPDSPVTLLHLSGDAIVDYRPDGSLVVTSDALRLTAQREGEKLLALPLVIGGELVGKMTKELRVSGTVQDKRKRLNGTFTGQFDTAAAQGTIAWQLAPFRLAPGGLTLAEISPAMAQDMPTFPMRLSARGNLEIRNGTWQLRPTVQFLELPLETLLAGVLGEDALVKGAITGAVPLEVSAASWQLKPSVLHNKGELHLAVSPTGRAAALVENHPQADMVLTALSNFKVDEMTLTAKSTDRKGGMHFTWHFLGKNPDLFGGKKVDFTLAVNANLQDIWEGAQQAKAAVRAAETNAARSGGN